MLTAPDLRTEGTEARPCGAGRFLPVQSAVAARLAGRRQAPHASSAWHGHAHIASLPAPSGATEHKGKLRAEAGASLPPPVFSVRWSPQSVYPLLQGPVRCCCCPGSCQHLQSKRPMCPALSQTHCFASSSPQVAYCHLWTAEPAGACDRSPPDLGRRGSSYLGGPLPGVSTLPLGRRQAGAQRSASPPLRARPQQAIKTQIPT